MRFETTNKSPANMLHLNLPEFAYGPLDHSRRDLAAVTIQRGRDHGLPDYNTARKAFNLHPVESFQAINNDTNVVSAKVGHNNNNNL